MEAYHVVGEYVGFRKVLVLVNTFHWKNVVGDAVNLPGRCTCRGRSTTWWPCGPLAKRPSGWPVRRRGLWEKVRLEAVVVRCGAVGEIYRSFAIFGVKRSVYQDLPFGPVLLEDSESPSESLRLTRPETPQLRKVLVSTVSERDRSAERNAAERRTDPDSADRAEPDVRIDCRGSTTRRTQRPSSHFEGLDSPGGCGWWTSCLPVTSWWP